MRRVGGVVVQHVGRLDSLSAASRVRVLTKVLKKFFFFSHQRLTSTLGQDSYPHNVQANQTLHSSVVDKLVPGWAGSLRGPATVCW